MRCAVGGECRLDRKAGGSHNGKQRVLGDVLDRPAGHEEHPVLVDVRPDHQVDRASGAGSDPIERWRGDHLSVDRRLPGHPAHRDLVTPP
jgi:hypothetical protein